CMWCAASSACNSAVGRWFVIAVIGRSFEGVKIVGARI
ncbi:MAG: hypothetical protein ACI84R_000786, partial [Candidatus Azotimanducaceae bacterium]